VTCIAHLSDLHFGRELPSIIDGLLKSLDTIQPELIIISGDLTQRATHREFRDARAFLDSLKQPYMIIPGNHDLSAYRLWERFIYPWRKWRNYISDDLQPVVKRKGFTATGVNTARRIGFYLDLSRGRISQHQVKRVCKVFKDTPEDSLNIVVAHHPFWLPESSLSRSLIGNRDHAIKSFSEAGVDLILGGHIHLAYVEPVKGIIVSHAGTSTSHRLIAHQPNSFNVIKGDRKQLVMEQMEWTGHQFECVNPERFKRTPHGWQLQ
jgi:3',5'-cyclic AMP phosphodiesterase CpdA